MAKWTAELLTEEIKRRFPSTTFKCLSMSGVNGRYTIVADCPEHGKFTVTKDAAFSGSGCKVCALRSRAAKRADPFEVVVEKARKMHGDTYQYVGLTRLRGKSALRIVCDAHGEFTMTSNSHLSGQGCPNCGREKSALSRTYSFETLVAKARLVHGDTYSYPEKVVGGPGRRKMVIECETHGEFVQNITNHLMGQGCPECGKVTSGLRRRKSDEDLLRLAKKVHGDRYEYLKIVRGGERPVLTYICKEHGEVVQNINSHLMGSGCGLCADKFRGINSRPEEQAVIARARKIHGDRYEYAGVTFDGKTMLTCICKIHGQFTVAATRHLMGYNCKRCAHSELGLSKRMPFEQFVARAKEVHGDAYVYEKLEYGEGAARIKYVCAKHGSYDQSAMAHLSGSGCGGCRGRISKPNVDIQNFLYSCETVAKLEFRFAESRKSFDIALEDAKVAIEYNGNYWHSSEWVPSNAHLEKTRIAESNGYRCIHIRSDEWANKRTAVEYLLKSAAGKITDKVYARKTQIVLPSKVEATRLLDTYHIQGAVSHGEFYGLEESGQLVAVMVFNRNTSSRREKASDSHVELTRYVTCKQVVGGFTKLLNHFLKENPQVQTIASYSDVRIFQGGVYEKAGFAKMHTTPPDYMYLEGDTLYHKANYQKSKLAKRFGAEACEGKTERQITEEQGIFRVYDCGKTKWLYTRK